ncbi:hypothetical protein [Specibacter sp. RAF43]
MVVSDLKMPGLDGLDLCRAIRATESDTCTVAVAVSRP